MLYFCNGLKNQFEILFNKQQIFEIMTTKKNAKNEGVAAIVAKEVENDGKNVANDLQPVEQQNEGVNEGENEEVKETVAPVLVDPFETATSYQEAKTEAEKINGENIAKIDEQINVLSVVVTDGKFDPVKFKDEFKINPTPWLNKLTKLAEIPDEITKLNAEKSAADVRKTSNKFAELFVGMIERPDEIKERLEELQTGLQNPEMSEDEKTEFESEKNALETELTTLILDDEQNAVLANAEEAFKKMWLENRKQLLINWFKTGSLGLNIGGVPRGTTTRKTSGATGATGGSGDFWQFTFAKDGKTVLQNSKQDVAYKMIIEFIKSSPLMLAAMVKKHGANWETPASATNTSGWVGRVKDALNAGGYTSNLQKVSA